jgi:DNA-binding response OmpR family regulator
MHDTTQDTARDDILIVEDSGLYVKHFETVFSTTSYSVSIITNGTAAWEKLKTAQPKILLLDWNLPGLDGVTICRRLREHKCASYVFVIMLTSMQRLEDIMTGFDAGADDYMVKPFEPAVLRAKVRVGMRLSDLEASNNNKIQLLARANLRQQSLIQTLEEKNRVISQQAQDIQKAQKQLVETARRAGMAEIATSVLHNVGNLLNSAMTSSTVIREAVGHSKVSTLSRLAEILRTRPEGLLEFVRSDPRGQKLTDFITEIAAALTAEHQLVAEKLQILAESQEQIRQIIALQQSYAGVTGVKDSIHLPGLIEDATRLFIESFKKHEIAISCDFVRELPAINVEKHKLLQILINLLQNARDATKSRNREDRLILIAVASKSPGTVAIELTDNGVGISPEVQQRIFNFGFTTKAGGHGFGLHGCANLAREMGGTLAASSPGPEQGATFTLTLPIK